MGEPAPFILTLTLDQVAQARLDALRAEHFPRERLVVGAHVTLFHALPRDLPIAAMVGPEAAAETTFPVAVTGLRFLGRGVAFVLESAALLSLRERLRTRFADRLTVQDRQAWRPHVTIQNKARPAVARDLYDRLSASFEPYTAMGAGLALWIYRDGPWEAAGAFAFSKPAV